MGMRGRLKIDGMRLPADFSSRPHSVERARHKLGRASAIAGVSSFRFEQLGVGENDAELVVQSVEEHTQVWRFVHRTHRDEFWGTEWPRSQTWVPSSCCQVPAATARSVRLGSRQSVSTKMRTEPPAVRMYSILPDDNQL